VEEPGIAEGAEPESSALAARVALVRDKIRRAGGSESVTVVAVTKGFGLAAVGAAARAGLLDIGENYANEMLDKLEGAPSGLRWHFLGELQRNKLGRLAGRVHLWHGLDRVVEAESLARVAPGAAVLVEVKAAEAPAGPRPRPGVELAQVPELVEAAHQAGLDVRGLMTVGPVGAGPGELSRHFRRVASLARELGLSEVSMGMSADFELAVAEGATMVRLGRALFGPRPAR